MTLVDIIQQGFQTYQNLAQAHPLLTTMATAQITFPVGDVIAQAVENRTKLEEDRNIDWKRTRFNAALASSYGAGLYGLMQTAELPAAMGLDSAFDKAALGPNLWGNGFNLLFYINNAIGKERNYSLRALGEFYKNITRRDEKEASTPTQAISNFAHNMTSRVDKGEYLKSVALVLTFWNAFQWANFLYVPEEMRTPAALSLSVPWNTLLTYLAVKSANKVAQSE